VTPCSDVVYHYTASQHEVGSSKVIRNASYHNTTLWQNLNKEAEKSLEMLLSCHKNTLWHNLKWRHSMVLSNVGVLPQYYMA